MIRLTGLKLDEHSVDVPPGLPELLTDAWVKKTGKPKLESDYERQVIKRDGRFVTVLTKKEAG